MASTCTVPYKRSTAQATVMPHQEQQNVYTRTRLLNVLFKGMFEKIILLYL